MTGATQQNARVCEREHRHDAKRDYTVQPVLQPNQWRLRVIREGVELLQRNLMRAARQYSAFRSVRIVKVCQRVARASEKRTFVNACA